MSSIVRRLAIESAIFIGLLTAATGHATPGVTGDSFGLSVSVDDGQGGTVTVTGDSVPFVGAAGSTIVPDLLAAFDAGSTSYEVGIDWVDADSFDLFFGAFGAIDLFSLSITVAELDFSNNGSPLAITGASFNRAASDVDTYDAGPSMPDPAVSFESRSVTAVFGFLPGALGADRPRLRFDVAAVPEPSAVLLLLSGLAVLGAASVGARQRERIASRAWMKPSA